MISRVHIVEDFQRMGHRIIVIGRQYPGEPTSYLKADGTWEPVQEGAYIAPDHHNIGFYMPEGILDAICQKHLGIEAPTPATERHLTDAQATRDRLLALIEKRGLR